DDRGILFALPGSGRMDLQDRVSAEELKRQPEWIGYVQTTKACSDEAQNTCQRAAGEQPQRVQRLAQDHRDGERCDQVTAPVVVYCAHQDRRAREHKSDCNRREAAANGVTDRGVGITLVEVPDE